MGWTSRRLAALRPTPQSICRITVSMGEGGGASQADSGKKLRKRSEPFNRRRWRAISILPPLSAASASPAIATGRRPAGPRAKRPPPGRRSAPLRPSACAGCTPLVRPLISAPARSPKPGAIAHQHIGLASSRNLSARQPATPLLLAGDRTFPANPASCSPLPAQTDHYASVWALGDMS